MNEVERKASPIRHLEKVTVPEEHVFESLNIFSFSHVRKIGPGSACSPNIRIRNASEIWSQVTFFSGYI